MQRRDQTIFALEALEPRILLSTDTLALDVVAVAYGCPNGQTPVSEEHTDWVVAPIGTGFAGDSAADTTDISDCLSADAPVTTPASAPEATETLSPSVAAVKTTASVSGSSCEFAAQTIAISLVTPAAQPAPDSNPTTNVTTVVPQNPDEVSSVAAQLTATLRSANGPPVWDDAQRPDGASVFFQYVSIETDEGAPCGEPSTCFSLFSLSARGDSALLSLIQQAASQWAELPAGKGLAARLSQVKVQIVDLAGGALAQANGEMILLDKDAAGHGWFIDSTPGDNGEFVLDANGAWNALPLGPAYGRVDLLSVLGHELGHVLGLDHLEAAAVPLNVMTGTFAPGQRLLPNSLAAMSVSPAHDYGTITGAFAVTVNGTEVTGITVPVGDLQSIVTDNPSQLISFLQGSAEPVTFTGTTTIAGQTLTGTFALDSETGQVLGGASSVIASLMSDDVGVQITGGSGGFVLTETGTALSIEGNAGFEGMPGLGMSGTLAVRINTLGSGAPESMTIPGTTTTLTFGFADDVNAFEGSPGIEILRSDNWPLIDIEGKVSIADNGTGVLLFDYSQDDLTVSVELVGIDLFSLEGTGQFTLGGSSTESAGFQLLTDSLDASYTILGVGVTPVVEGGDEYFVTSIGPLELKGVEVSMSNLTYTPDGLGDGVLAVGFGVSAAEAKLAWGGDGAPDKQTSVDFCFPELSFALDIAVDGATGVAGAVSFGGFSIHSDTMDVKKPDMFTVSALEPTISYDPNWAPSADPELDPEGYAEELQWGQRFLLLSDVDVKIDPLNLKITLGTIEVDGVEIPALQIYEHGFKLGRGKITLTGDHTIGPIKLTDPFIEVTDLWAVKGAAFSFSGTIAAGAKSLQIGQTGGVFSLTGTGNEAGDPALKVTLLFTDNIPSGFEIVATKLTANSDFLRLSIENVTINARTRLENGTLVWDLTADDQMMYFGSLSATLVLGAVEIGGTASKFAVMGNGAIVPDPGFEVKISIGAGADADAATTGLKWPSWLPIKSAEVGVRWPDFNADPTNMQLDLSIAIDVDIGPVHVGGSVENAIIDLKRLKEGKFPVIGLGSASITASGKLFGGDVSGSLFIGLIRLDADGRRILATDTTTEVADTVFYGGISAGITLAGMGLEIKLGLSELGPLQVYMSAKIPILLEPTSGLTLYGFRAGIAFNAAPFPDIDTTSLDTIATSLRSPRFKPCAALTDEQWQDQLEQQVANQVGGQYGYLFSLEGNAESSILAHVTAMNSGQTILDEMTKAFMDRGMPMSTLYACVTPLELNQAWVVDYQNTRYLVEYREIMGSGNAALDISRTVLTLTDVPEGPDYTDLLDNVSDPRAPPQAIIEAFAEGGLALSATAVVDVQTAGEKWMITEDGTVYLIAKKGTDDGTGSTGNNVLIVTVGGGSQDSLNLGTIRIEAGATLGFASVPQTALRGDIDMILEITPVEGGDPQVKFLISGSLLFADGKLTATAKMFADLSNIGDGGAALYFLMDVPETPRVLSIVGQLTLGFVDANGQSVPADDPTVDAYQIQLQGKGELTAGGFLGIVCEGSLTMTFSDTRFELAFDVSISIEGIISAEGMVSAAGILVVDNEDDFEMWGVMKFNVDSTTLDQLADIGISFEADVILKLNIGGPAEGRDVELTLPDRDPELFHLPQNSFALYIYGDATFCPPGGLFSLGMTGAFALELNKTGVRIFLLASFEFEVLEVPIMEFEALGLMAVVITYDEYGEVTGGGFAARLELARRLDIPLLEFEIEFQLYINTLGEDVVYDLPSEFAEKLGETLPEDLAARIEGGQISVPAGPPRLDGLFLVGVEEGYVTSLDAGSVPDALETKFKDNGCKLMSSSPTVATLTSGSTWLVTDTVVNGEETYIAQYLIEKTEGGTGLIITSQMFVMDSTGEMVTELDGGSTIPDSIEQLFTNANLALAPDADLSVVEAGAAWTIESGANRYLLEKHGTKLLVMEPRAGPAGFYLIIAGGGHLTLLETFTLEGRFRIEASVSGFEMDVYAGLELGILGHLRAAGTLSITNEGLVAALELELEAGLPLGPGVGIDIQGEFALAINTTDAAVNLNVPTVGGGSKSIQLPKESIQIHVEGSFNFLGFITASGWVDLFLSSEQFTFEGHISFALSNAISASADVLIKVVYTDNNNSSDDGVVIYANVSLDVNLPSPSIPIFHIAADGTLEVNTTQTDYTYTYEVNGTTHSVVLERKSFLLDLNGELSVLGVLKLDAGFKIQVGGGTFTHNFSSTINNTPFGTLGPANYSQTLQSGDWAIGFSADLSFFGLATLGASGWLNSDGNFDIRVAGELVIGTRSFGLVGEFHFRVWLNETEFGLRLGASVGARLFGITLASIGFDASFTASRGENSSGKVSIDLSVTLQIQILFVKITKTATFHVGTLQLPPVPNLAERETDGTLRLNTGTRANLRGVGQTEINEAYYIEHMEPEAGDPPGERIRVTAFGYSEEYTGVTKIVGNGGTGDDVFIVRSKDTNDDDIPDSFVGVPVEFYGEAGDDVLVYDGEAATGTIVLNGGEGSNYLEVGEDCTASAQLTGGSGADQLIHHGSDAGTLSGGGGGDQIVGGSGADTITGGDGDDEITGNGGIDMIDAGNGNDIIYWKTGDGVDVGTSTGTPVAGGVGTDTFHYTGTANAERFRVSVSSGNLLVQTLDSSDQVTETFTASGIEKLYIDAAGGGDRIEVMDLAGTAITEVKVDLGLVIASSQTVIVGQDLDNDGEPDTDPSSGRLLSPEEVTIHTFANDNAADVLTIHGRNSAADDLVVYTDTTWLLEGQTMNEVRVKRAADTTDAYLVYNGLRNSNTTQTDRLIINTGGGNDEIDASGVDDADLLVLELVGGAGNDTLLGSRYGDVLDSGSGNDTVTGGAGTDTFRDESGTDVLVEAQDKDLALFGNRFVAGTITNLYGTHNDDWVLRNGAAEDAWNTGAEVEDLTGGTGTCLFEEARISGGANSNILVVGDRDGSITVGGGVIAVTPWAAKVTLDNKTNSGENLAPEKYILNLTGTGTGNVWIEDSGGSVGSDTLWIFGTSAADTLTLDKQTINSVVYGKVLVKAAGSSVDDTVYYREIENFAVSTLGGDDVLQLNDNLNTTNIYTGAGADSITIGYVATVENDEDVPVVDLANTTNGVSAETFIYGGADNDDFEINHNLAILWLYGEEGDDRFVQYSFLVDLNSTTLPLSGEDDVTLDGGGGSNQYEFGDPGPLGSTRYVYLQNNLVHIEGGSGTDTYVIVGSPLADYFILTANYLLGGGLNTTFSGIEVLELDTGAGDDVIYVLGSSASMDVSVVTGSGNDIVHVGGEAPAMKVVLPAHLVTPDPVLRQDMRRIYPFYTHPAYATSSTFSGTSNLAAPVTLDWIVDGTAHYHWYYPSGAYWSAWKSGVVGTYSSSYAALAGRYYQTQLPVDAYAGYSFLSTTGESTYLQSALNAVLLNQTIRNWQWDDRAWNQHQYVYYTVQFNYTFPAVTYVDQLNWRYMAPYAYSPPSTEVPSQEYWAMLPKVDSLTGFDGKVTVDGGSSTYTVDGQQYSHTDELFIHNENGAASTDGHLTSNSLTGLGLSSDGISYSNFEELDLRLGANNDTLTIDGTHAGKTDVVLGAGNDSVTVNAVSGETNILGGAGADTVTAQGNATSGLSNIAEKLHFFGNAHRYDVSTGTGVYQPVANLDANGLPAMEWIPFTQLPQYIFADAAVFTNTGAVLEGQTQWQYGTQRFAEDNRTPLLQNFTVQRQQVATTSTQLRAVTTQNTTVSDNATDRLVIADSAAYTTNTTGSVSSTWVTGLGMAVGIQYEQLEDLRITLGGGADTLTVTGLATPAEINGGLGGDTITIQNGNHAITVNGNAGNDTVNVCQISAAMTINAGAGNDVTNVGSTAGTTPATAGNVNGISALLTVNGDGNSDTLNVDDTSDTAANTGTLTGTQLTGLGMSNGITYGTLEIVNINLGSEGDTFTVESTHAGTTTVNSNTGQDTVRVKTISGTTNINTADDRDTINVWNDSNCLDDIGALLTVNMGDPTVIGAGDHLDIRDTGNTTGRSGTLTATALTGLGMDGSISYSAVELLDLSLGSGPDILRIKSTSAVTNVNTGAGDDQINVWNDTSQIAGIAQSLTIDAGDPTASDTLTLSDAGTSAATTGTLTNTSILVSSMPGSITYSHVETLTISLGSGGDSFVVVSTHTATTVLNAGPGGDTVTAQTISGTTTINGEADADTVNVRTISAATTVNGGMGNDIVNVGSAAGAAPAEAGNVNSISALLTVNGDGNSDTLNVDDTSDTAANTGTLTSTQLIGLGMSGSITYATLETANINLGSGGDNFTIESTHANTTTVETNSGDDTVRVKTIAGASNVNTGTGRDTVNVWNDSNALDDIDATLTINAGDPTALDAGDLLDVRDTGSATNRTGTITSSRISGLGMGGVIDYSAVEGLDVTLGAFQDVLWIKSISAVTTVLTGAGDDQINVWDDSNRLQGIAQLLTINAGEPSASDSLDIRDTGNTGAVTGNLTNNTLSLSSMVGLIVYQAVESLTISLGFGGDGFTIQTTHTNSTVLNTGSAADTVTVETNSGETVINGEGGDDRVHVRTISAATTVNGGDGNDTIYVGSLAPATGGNVNSISALLTVNGDGIGDTDTLNVDDTADSFANTGTLTSTQLTGLGMSHGINYTTLEDLNISLGSGDDIFHILSTHTGTTDLFARAGADVVNIRTTAGQTTVETADDNDTINVGSLAPVTTGGTLNSLVGLVIVRAGNGSSDTLNVDDSGDGSNNTGELTATTITGLGMGGGIQYEALETLNLWLGAGSDTFTAHSTHAQLTNLYGGPGSDRITLEDAAGMTNIRGGGDSDTLTVDTLSSLFDGNADGIRDTMNLDGQAAGDAYIIHITGSGDYLVNVLDTGSSGTDMLTVNGTATADELLLRASEHEYPAGIAFVAALHGDPVADVERVNYNKAIEQLTANGNNGDDHITLDDVWALTTVTGGEGRDTFQVGQVFKSERDAVHANIAGEDEFATTLTTRGYLSNGVSYETSIEGNGGNDVFVVFRNLAGLHLYGGDGDDSFTIRAFALEGSHTTELTGQGGADYVEYVLNALVNVLGGDGTDSLKVIGTEFSDQIVITATGIFGMGINVTYGEIEKLEVDGAEGNDLFYILSTGLGVETWLYGGLGSDRFSIAGDVPQIMSGSTEIYPATPGSHKLDAIQGLLHIEGLAGVGSAGGLGNPVMIPGETNVLPSTGMVLSYDGTGASSSIDTMTVATADLQAFIDADTTDSLTTFADLVGFTLEISAGPGVGRFWQITSVVASNGTTTFTLMSPAMPASEWKLPNETSRFAITHLCANFFVNESGQVDFVTVYNNAAIANQSGALTATTITGLGMVGGGITYGALEVLEVFLGSGVDTFTVTGTMKRDDGFRTITMLSTGAGNDDVTVELTAGVHGFFALNTESGNDHVHAGTSRLSLVVFGGDGDDWIQSGAGNDIVFGDQGRVDYRNASGTLITRLGLGLAERNVLQAGETEDSSDDVPFMQTDGNAYNPVLITTREATTGGADDMVAGDGNNIILGGATGDEITADSGINVALGDHGTVTFQSAQVLASIVSTDEAEGGADTITLGVGTNTVVAGTANDIVVAGQGTNVVLGDSGSLVYAAGGWLQTATTITAADGGMDDIDLGVGTTGNWNLILGGAAGDTIDTGSGTNIVVGDHGTVIFQSAQVLASILSTDEAEGGSDTITLGDGTNIVVAGTANDIIIADQGTNVVLGDSGSLVYAAGGWLQTAMTTTTADGGVDDIDVAVETNGNRNLVLGGAAGDTIDAGSGANIVVGDHGVVTFKAADALGSILSTNETAGGDDTIILGIGINTVVAGTGRDIIEAGQGRNVVVGDSGSLTYGTGGWLQEAKTTTTADGAADDIDVAVGTTGNRNLVLGGAAGDTIDAGSGTNIVLGDHGIVTFQAANVLESILSTDKAEGGDDTITTGIGVDTIVGGIGDDVIIANSGEVLGTADDGNIVVGDNVTVSYDATGVLASITSTSTTAYGGADTITTGAGNDIVIGGRDGDKIDAGGAGNIVVGDSGHIVFATGVLTRIETTEPSDGGADRITTGTGNDIVLGGQADDTIHAGDGNNIVLGDNGFVDWITSDSDPSDIDQVWSTDSGIGGADEITTGSGCDLIFGGTVGDAIHAGAGSDLVFGDHGKIEGNVNAGALPLELITKPFIFTSIDTQDADSGGNDVIHGEDGEDIILGGQGSDTIYGGTGDDDIIGGHNVADGFDSNDRLDGGAGNDLIAGDNAILLRRADLVDPRIRVLGGAMIYDANGNVLVTGAAQADPQGTSGRNIAILNHSSTTSTSLFGNDSIAGGAGNDMIFGQLGDDTIQGDGSTSLNVAAWRSTDNLVVSASQEDFGGAGTDGDDYIEGNGGNDLIFGNLGQDDIIGGSSSLFGLTTPAMRPDESDVIFGGAGTDIERNSMGDQSHGRDSDMILGDNDNIYRLVGTGGTTGTGFLAFSYDNYVGGKIVVRAAELLDYTPGGPDCDAAKAATDIGAVDEIHGESGDDFIYGMVGNDVLFGEAQDDDLIGGWGNDWISGGTGDDGVLGDDGRIYTSRNGTAEPLYALDAASKRTISTPGKIQQATINENGYLKKSVDVTPFNPDPDGAPLCDPQFADDIIFGGWGNDFLHGGSGDDAISGAEALPGTAAQAPMTNYDQPANPGDILRYSACNRVGEFGGYCEYYPLAKICVDANGEFVTDGSGFQFLLNFDATEGPLVADSTTIHSDGSDVIFGDLGNDWLVGGTGKDHLYGGYGDDLLNADDDHDSTKGTSDSFANNIPDTAASYEDIAYGGAGRDVLIGNTGGDRLIDWAGEFNSYLVPFAPFGAFAISRALMPGLMEYLYDLSEADGADRTRDVDEGREASDPRHGEPFGELGLVMQKDFDWHGQTGAPDDLQPGNIPGGARDVLRGANFNNVANTTDEDGTLIGFAADSGSWSVQNGRLQVSPSSLGADAASVFYVDSCLPLYFEIRATINAAKPLAGSKSNAYLIFDYVSPTDFKFAGVNISTDKIEMGHRTAGGWIVDVQAPAQVKPDQDYNLLLSINGNVATLVVNNSQLFSFAFAPSIDAYGVAHGLNRGMVGLGANNSSARIDNLAVQILPPQFTLNETETFSDNIADRFADFASGIWHVADGVYTGQPAFGATTAFSTVEVPIGPAYLMRFVATVSTSTMAGIVFDQYADDDFKFAAISVETRQVILGHYTARGGWKVDAAVTQAITAGQNYSLGVTLKGTSASVTFNGQSVLSFVYNALTVDGDYGLFTERGTATFDSVTMMTDDPAYGGQPGSAPEARDDLVGLAEDTSVTISHAFTLGNDSDPDGGVLTITAYSQPSHGTLVSSGEGWTYTPAANFNGADSFTYTITDAENGTATAMVYLTVAPVNDAPVAGNDSLATDQNVPLIISTATLLANDGDVDGEVLAVTGMTQPANGTLTAIGDGTWTYTPAANYLGDDSFAYTIGDGYGGTATGTVSLTVRPIVGTTTYNGTGGAIKDASTTRFTLNITDIRTILDLNVKLTLTHAALQELTVFLISPTGTKVQLVGGLTGANLTDTVLDDAASALITSGSSPYTGTFRPVGNLAAFEGQALDGTWTLEIRDKTRRNVGELVSWSLMAEGGSPLLATDTPGAEIVGRQTSPLVT